MAIITEFDITFCGNSGFLVGVNGRLIVIDYVAALFQQSFVNKELLESYETIIVLCSHGHFDHYQSDVLSWVNIRSDITYVFSDDIVILDNERPTNFYAVKAGDYLEVHGLNIQCYESTDLGVAFDIQTDQFRFFHAADLNDWHWLNEYNTNWTTEQAQRFYKILQKIPQEPPISVACLPVDARMEIDYYRGAREMIRRLTPQYTIPMHFGPHFQTEFDPPKEFWIDVEGFTDIQAVYKPGDHLILSTEDNFQNEE